MKQEILDPVIPIDSELLRQAILPHEFGGLQNPHKCKGGLPQYITSLGGAVFTSCPGVCQGRFNWATGAWIGPIDV